MPLIQITGLDRGLLRFDGIVESLNRVLRQAKMSEVPVFVLTNREPYWEAVVAHELTRVVRSSTFPTFSADTVVTVDFARWQSNPACNLVVIVRGLFVRHDRTRSAKMGLLAELRDALRPFVSPKWDIEMWTESLDTSKEAYRAR